MAREVRLTERALADITGIGDYIAQRAPDTATLWVGRLRESIATLGSTADSHAIVYGADRVGRDVRQTFFGAYRILYEIRDDRVYVLTVRHGARRPIGPGELDDPGQ